MEEYFNSKKYVILLVVVCLLFTVIVTKFFDYLPQPIDKEELDSYSPASYQNLNVNPEEYNQAPIKVEESTIEEEDDDDEDDDNEDNNNTDNAHKSGHIDFGYNNNQNFNNFDEIPAPKGSAEEIIEAQ